MASLNTAVIGVGAMGERHARAYAESPRVVLDTIIDVDEERAATIADEYNANRIATSISEVSSPEDIDLVTIATPDNHHLDPTRRALENGWHVLLEKPLAADAAEAEQIGEMANNADTKLMIGHLLRFDPRYANLKREIEEKEFGQILGIQAARISSIEGYHRVGEWASPLTMQAIHDIDIMIWYTGAEVERVYAEASEGIDGLDAPGIVHSTLQFENGIVGLLETNWVRPETYPTNITEEVRVTGKDGYGQLLNENRDVEISSRTEFYSTDTSAIHGQLNNSLRWEIDHFIDCIQDDTEPLVPWTEAIKSVRVTDALAESMTVNVPVEVD